jgi:hypothetical protein
LPAVLARLTDPKVWTDLLAWIRTKK